MVSGSISFSAGCSWSPGFLNTSFQSLLMPSSISFKRSSKVIVRPLKVMVSFPFRALCHVFSVLSSLLENKLSKRSHFDSPYIMFPNMKIFYCFPKNCQNFKPEYVSKSMISKTAPLLRYMLDDVRIGVDPFPRCLDEFLLEPPSATRKESKATVLDMR